MAATEHTAVKLDKDVLCWRRTIDTVVTPVLITFRETDADGMEDSVTMQGEADTEDLIHAPALTPSISTYNIAEGYGLDFEMTLRLFNTTFTLSSADSEIGNPRIVMLPASSSVDDKSE